MEANSSNLCFYCNRDHQVRIQSVHCSYMDILYVRQLHITSHVQRHINSGTVTSAQCQAEAETWRDSRYMCNFLLNDFTSPIVSKDIHVRRFVDSLRYHLLFVWR